MTIRIIDDGTAAKGSVFGRGNDFGAGLLEGGDGLIQVGYAKAEAGGGGGIGVVAAGVDFESGGAELGGVMLRAGAVGVLGEDEPEKLVEARGAVDVGGADDEEVEGGLAHLCTGLS